MNDPHVASLRYRITVDEPYEFSNPPDLDIETKDFAGRLSSGVLTLVPKEHFPNEYEIKPIADAFVLAWEVDTGLRDGHRVRFHFEGCDVIDLNPSPSMAFVFGTSAIASVGNVTLKVFKTAYPNPPAHFTATPEVDMLWARYCQYWVGKEPLQGTAYFCYSVLKSAAGSNRAASHQFGIQEKVLTKLRELSSERGDNLSVRKLTPRTAPLAENERNWLECAIKTVIHHLGTRSAGTKVEMKDLPSL
jgi:hypothetical protein